MKWFANAINRINTNQIKMYMRMSKWKWTAPATKPREKQKKTHRCVSTKADQTFNERIGLTFQLNADASPFFNTNLSNNVEFREWCGLIAKKKHNIYWNCSIWPRILVFIFFLPIARVISTTNVQFDVGTNCVTFGERVMFTKLIRQLWSENGAIKRLPKTHKEQGKSACG